jgi:hypothetical protein
MKFRDIYSNGFDRNRILYTIFLSFFPLIKQQKLVNVDKTRNCYISEKKHRERKSLIIIILLSDQEFLHSSSFFNFQIYKAISIQLFSLHFIYSLFCRTLHKCFFFIVLAQEYV